MPAFLKPSTGEYLTKGAILQDKAAARVLVDLPAKHARVIEIYGEKLCADLKTVLRQDESTHMIHWHPDCKLLKERIKERNQPPLFRTRRNRRATLSPG